MHFWDTDQNSDFVKKKTAKFLNFSVIAISSLFKRRLNNSRRNLATKLLKLFFFVLPERHGLYYPVKIQVRHNQELMNKEVARSRICNESNRKKRHRTKTWCISFLIKPFSYVWFELCIAYTNFYGRVNCVFRLAIYSQLQYLTVVEHYYQLRIVNKFFLILTNKNCQQNRLYCVMQSLFLN